VSPRDLSRTALATFRKLAKDSRRLDSTVLREPAAGLLDKLNLLEGGHLKRAAVLIFHPDPERFITGAFVKIGFFRTESGLLYHDEVRGDLFMQTRQTMDLLLTKYLKAAISYRGIHRVEALPVPEAALREAVLNAVIHKDYASHSPVQIRVYADKLKIWNPGLLPENWSVENLLGEHASRPFNPAVANAFFRAGEIEAWGRGIERILSACKAEGTPAPLIRYQPNDLWLEFPFSRAYIETMSGLGGGLAPTPGQTTGTTPKTTLETTLNTTQRVLAILLSHPSASRREIAGRLGDITEDGVKYQLHKLRQAGTIRHVGPAKGGRWEVLP
jgi:ATP-dependent DNA helicase RecG